MQGLQQRRYRKACGGRACSGGNQGLEVDAHIQGPLPSPEVGHIQVETSAPREWVKLAYIEELKKALRHHDPDVRIKVANALKELEDPRATIPLIEALDDCEEVRRDVAWALQGCADHRALPTLIQMLRDHNDSVRLWATIRLQRLGDTEAVIPLTRSLSDEYDAVRENAVIALGKIGDRRAINPLIKALDDPDSNVRTEAEYSLKEVFKIED